MREKMKEKLGILNEYLNDSEFGKYVSLINDGDLKAVSSNCLMFMYKTELMAESFNLDLIKIEELFEKCFNEKYKVIAIDLNDWNFIKVDYNSNKDKYVYNDEKITLKDIFDVEKTNLSIKNNKI